MSVFIALLLSSREWFFTTKLHHEKSAHESSIYKSIIHCALYISLFIAILGIVSVYLPVSCHTRHRIRVLACLLPYSASYRSTCLFIAILSSVSVYLPVCWHTQHRIGVPACLLPHSTSYRCTLYLPVCCTVYSVCLLLYHYLSVWHISRTRCGIVDNGILLLQMLPFSLKQWCHIIMWPIMYYCVGPCGNMRK